MRSFRLQYWALLGAILLASSTQSLAADKSAKDLVVAPDLSSQLAKFKRVPMKLEVPLTSREKQMVDKLIEASRYLDIVFWQQSDAQGWQLYNELAASKAPRDMELRRYLRINGSRYDLIRNQAPFVGTTPRPPGADLYPADLTKPEVERYVQAHPGQQQMIYDPFAVIRRDGPRLKAIP